MRTTLTLEPDVARLIEEEMHRQRKPFKIVVNEAIRRGLVPRLGSKRREPYRVTPHEGKLMPGIDPAGLNKLADEFEDEALIAKMRRS
ncbi:hypothetical protein LZC95_24060 [Pendulispora brunnea]|uniref:Antitoxin n=1 Tax=Pendulispora brunnea TaxID=2905690 RepID=A0ABZ2KQ88_9BACT